MSRAKSYRQDMPNDEESLRSNRNEYPGYLAGKGLEAGERVIRLDFNPLIQGEAGKGNRIARFNLRMFEKKEGGPIRSGAVEIGVNMTTEQWQDLIDAMKAELELARETRDGLDALDGE